MTTPERLKSAGQRPSREKSRTRRVRARIIAKFEDYPVISIIVAAILLPGGFVVVPFIAWWYRRKRALKRAIEAKPATRINAEMPPRRE